MATTDIKYTLNAQITDYQLTGDDKTDKILTLVSAGTAGMQRIVSEIMEMNPGFERETVEAILNIEQRVVKKLLLTGHNVNTGLYQAVAQFTGLLKNKQWNPEINTVYTSFIQGAELREDIRRTSINIIGEKASAMYIAGLENTATRATDATATAGRNFTITGSLLKIAGTHPSVGISLISAADKSVTPIPSDMWALNTPSKLIFLIPAEMRDGEYTLRITTQYSRSSNTLLKEPRSLEQPITIGNGGGEVEDPTA